MRKILLCASIATVLFSGCSSNAEKNKENIVYEKFLEYVETDYGDTDNFIEVTEVECIDSLNHDMVKETLSSLEDVSEYLGEEEKDSVRVFKELFRKKDESVYMYRIKVRERCYGGKRIKKYYATLYKGKAKIFIEKPYIHQLEGNYKRFYEFCLKIIGE